MAAADLVRAIDALELEVRGHLDVSDHDVRRELGRPFEQRWGILGDAHDLDVVLEVEQRLHAGAHEHVVVGEHDPQRHEVAFRPCSIGAWPSAWCSPRTTTWSG